MPRSLAHGQQEKMFASHTEIDGFRAKYDAIDSVNPNASLMEKKFNRFVRHPIQITFFSKDKLKLNVETAFGYVLFDAANCMLTYVRTASKDTIR